MKIVHKDPGNDKIYPTIWYSDTEGAYFIPDRKIWVFFQIGNDIGVIRYPQGGWRIDDGGPLWHVGPFPSRRAAWAALKLLTC